MGIPPSRSELKSLAGWAMSAGDLSSNEQQTALWEFKNGCAGLEKVIDDLAVAVAVTSPVKQGRKEQQVMSSTCPPQVPDEVKDYLSIEHDGECRHKFNITTQKCNYCSRTYRDVAGRTPELF